LSFLFIFSVQRERFQIIARPATPALSMIICPGAQGQGREPAEREKKGLDSGLYSRV
jgi:hypothetical protein